MTQDHDTTEPMAAIAMAATQRLARARDAWAAYKDATETADHWAAVAALDAALMTEDRPHMLTTRDEAMRDLADRAADQAEALANKLTAVIDEVDEDGEAEDETLRGLALDPDGRETLVFAADGVSQRRTRIYVDAILKLARLIKGEPRLEDAE